MKHGLSLRFVGTARRAMGAVVWLLAVGLAVQACTYTATGGIEIERGRTVEEKLAVAKTVASEDGLRRLKAQIESRMPQVKAADLDALSIQTTRRLAGNGVDERVSLVVSLQSKRGVDADSTMNAIVEILKSEVK